MDYVRALTASGLLIATFVSAPVTFAQVPGKDAGGPKSAGVLSGDPAEATRTAATLGLTEREAFLLQRIEELEGRLAALEARMQTQTPAARLPLVLEGKTSEPPVAASPVAQAQPLSVLPFGTMLNFFFDGYYGYNFNRPVGRVNLLRAYDASSNSFSLNQAGMMVERLPDVSAGRRFGFRLDLMYGQATETLQGSAVNEPRPQVYRPVFQAYGSYVGRLGSGLLVDFGKWASPLGFENNYTKDQINYSRSYFFNFLPFYHFGFRASYPVNNKLSLGYWLVNGANQSEDFNGFKSQVVSITIKPTSRVAWTLQYHVGREQRDITPLLNPGLPSLPTQPGLSTNPVLPTPRGRLHILNTYATWNARPKLLLAGEFDAVWNRFEAFSPPTHVIGGALYSRYLLTPRFSLAGRFEYLSDRGGFFSGRTQALKESTLTATYGRAEGFQTRLEWRRDFSNQPYFLTARVGALKKEQNTITLGLLWWFGGKQGPW